MLLPKIRFVPSVLHLISPRYYSSTPRFLSKDANHGFDPIMVQVYQKIAQAHAHPRGPWNTMLQKVESVAQESPMLTVLDLASGPGEPALTIARALPKARVIATDLSPDQVAAGQKRATDTTNISFQVADMEDLSAFDTNSIDCVTCCYGYMFPSDVPKALAETFRVLKPGAPIIATTWNSLSMLRMLHDILERAIEREPPALAMNPESLREPELFERLLQEAGFMNVVAETDEYPFNFTNDPEFQFAALTMLQKDFLEKEGEATKAQVRHVFESTKHNFSNVEITATGDMIIHGSQYKLSMAYKPLS